MTNELKDKFAEAGKKVKERKYYIPTVEELLTFLVNEKYILNKNLNPISILKDVPTGIWYFLQINDIEYSIKEKEYSINCDEYRIKYLDKEDIESFGFESLYVVHADSQELVSGFELHLNEKEQIIIHEIDKNTFVIYKAQCYNEISGNWNQIDLFRGIIKNKSELKILLKQLGIYE